MQYLSGLYKDIACYVTVYTCYIIVCTGKRIHRLAAKFVWPTILSDGSKIIGNCRRGAPDVVFGVPF